MGDFVKVAETKDIQPSKMIAVEVDGEKVCVANVEGKYYAIGNVCTHMGGPLAEGKLEGNVVECPWHGSTFSFSLPISQQYQQEQEQEPRLSSSKLTSEKRGM